MWNRLIQDVRWRENGLTETGFLGLSLTACLSLRWEQFDKNYLSKLLLRKSVYRKSELWEAYQKINIRDAISVIDQVGRDETVQSVYSTIK